VDFFILEFARRLGKDEETIRKGIGAFLSGLMLYLKDEDYARIHGSVPGASAMIYLFQVSKSILPAHQKFLSLHFNEQNNARAYLPILSLMNYLFIAGFSQEEIARFMAMMAQYLNRRLLFDVTELIEPYFPGFHKLISGMNISQIFHEIELVPSNLK